MTRLRAVLSIAGVALLAWLVWGVGPGPIVDAVARITWWQLALVVLAHGVALTLDALGWRYAFPRNRVPFRTLLAARTAGEAVNLASALASVGGEAVKAWLIRGDVSYRESIPSVIVAKTASVVAQALFLLAGLAVAWMLLDWRSRVMTGMLWLLLIEILAVGGFLATQVSGAIARAGRLVRAVGLVGAEDSVAQLDADLRAYYRTHWRRFLVSVGWHAAGCAGAVAETWLIVWAIGAGTSAAVAVVVDSLGSGIRFATFLVPASLGALESGNAAAFAALGLGAGAGIAFSLVRRARQVIWIGLGLFLLLAMRSRGRRRARRAATAS